MHYLLFVESEHQYSFFKTSLVCLIIYCESSLRLLSAILSAEYFQTLFLVIMHQEKRIKSLKLGAFNNLIKTVFKVFNVIISWTYLRPHISPPPDCLVILIVNLDLKVPDSTLGTDMTGLSSAPVEEICCKLLFPFPGMTKENISEK